jgi:hypothetical protein
MGAAPGEGVGGVRLDFHVDTMNVRSEQDIRRISRGVADLVKGRNQAQGNLGWAGATA